MDNYQIYSEYYDSLEGSQKEKSEVLSRIIKKHNPKATSILEIACGTGNILEHLKHDFDVQGLDLSPSMLRIAKNKLQGVPFYKQDMQNFNVDKKFDVVLCIYDSINHVTTFKGWSETFKSVKKHLKSAGLFIFDINTVKKLVYLSAQNTYFKEFDGGYMAMKVTKSKDLFDWNIKIFSHIAENKYLLEEESVQEASFEIDKIKAELAKSYSVMQIIDYEGKPITEDSSRPLFVCKALDG